MRILEVEELRMDMAERKESRIDWRVRPSRTRGARVGRQAAMTEQQGSTRDQIRTLATTALVGLV